jgi:hypothetical protein
MTVTSSDLVRHRASWARRAAVAVTIATVACLGFTRPASADTVLSGSVGYFVPKGFDSRPADDVLSQNLDFLLFELDDFHGGTLGGEFMVGLGDFLEAGVGAGFYQRTVPSIYAGYVDSDGTEVDQDLKLRVAPVTFTARLFPLGRNTVAQPYVGGGLALLSWRYTESGEFIDFDLGQQVFRDTFTDNGTEIAPVVFGGLRFAASDAFLIGGELRWHGGEADLDPAQGFAGDRIDLGGYTVQATCQVRF